MTDKLRQYIGDWIGAGESSFGLDPHSDAVILGTLLDLGYEKPLWEGDAEPHRWWITYDAVVKVGHKFVKFTLAKGKEGLRPREIGWVFDVETVHEVWPTQKIVTVYEPVEDEG